VRLLKHLPMSAKLKERLLEELEVFCLVVPVL